MPAAAPPPLATELAAIAARDAARAGGAPGSVGSGPAAPVRPTDSPRLLLDLIDMKPAAGRAPGEPLPRASRDALVAALRHRDRRTLTHSHRAAWLAGGVARGLGVSGEELKLVETAALLHDVGKIGVPDNILHKPGALCDDEAELMTVHRGVGLAVLQACGAGEGLLEVVERAGLSDLEDAGSGRRRGERYDLPARVVALTEAYDALRTAQPYRDGYAHGAAMAALAGNAGHRYDPVILDNLGRWVAAQGDPDQLDGLLDRVQGPTADETLGAVRLCHVFGYLATLETLYEGFCLLDGDLRCGVWSPGLEGLLGAAPAEMLGEVRGGRTLEFLARDGRPLPEAARPLDRVLTTGRPVAEQVKVRRPGGEWADCEVQVFPLVDGAGGVRGVAEIYRNLNRERRRPREFQELRRAATRDALTGVANRGELETRLARALRESEEEGRPLSVMFLDLDHFKTVNDTWGHDVGDEVLKHLASLLKSECYSGETVGRYGGEEFVVVCPQTDLDAAAKRADRLRRVIAETKVNGRSQPRPTASFGVSCAEPGDTVETLVKRADTGLYRSKETGRNKVTALTRETMAAADAPAEADRDRAAAGGPLKLEITVQACLAASMIVHKLRGYLEDTDGKVLAVSETRLQFKLGSAGITGRWGRRRDDRPVEVTVTVGAEHMRTRTAASLSDVTIAVEPLGWGVKRPAFDDRAGEVVRTLRGYLAAG